MQASGASTRDFAKALHGLFDAARDLRLGGSSYRSGVSALGRTARSSGPLGLSATPTPTTLSSYEEANTIPTSYTPSEPDWVGNSNGNPTIGGIYDGSNGDTTLTFTVLVGGRVGQDPILIEVRDGQGGLVDTISMLNEPPDTVFTLSNGLDVSFDNGQIRLNDSFTVDVFNSIPSSIDPFAKFNGAGGDDPNFEPGFEVTSGSFEVNGVVINVGAGDTVMSVIEKITTSGAGVTASFDFATEQVVLTQDTPGPGETITLANDTSGFLAALKLDGATPVPGAEDESGTVLADVAAFAGVQTGTFRVNGVDIAVDVDQDSLADVLERINASAANVVATYDATSQRVTLRAEGSGAVVLEDVDSGFPAAILIEEGTYEPTSSSVRTRFRNEVGFRRSLEDFVRAFEEVFDQEYAGFGAATVATIREDVEQAVETVFDEVLGKEGRTLRSGLGLDYVARRDDHRELSLSRPRLERALRNDREDLVRFLFSREEDDGVDGLVARLEATLGEAARRVETILGPEATVGLRLDAIG